jgi:GLPGLI family protein
MKHSLLLILFISPFIVVAQKSVKITYEQKSMYSDAFFNQIPEGSRESFRTILAKPSYFELINNGDYSLFKSINLKEEVIPSNEINTSTSINQGTIFKPLNVWLLKDFVKEISSELAVANGKDYYLEQPFSKETLFYDEKTKTIDAYRCKGAYTLTTANDTIRYWYTQEIPLFDGPFSRYDIPGLVLSVESKKKITYATKIEFFDKKLVLDTVPKNAVFVTKQELENIRLEARKPKSYTDEYGNKHESHSVHIKADN